MKTVSNASGATATAVFRSAVEVAEEVSLELSGKIPRELRGTLYRNGPAQFERGGFVAAHPADGDGLVSKFVIDDGEVRFQSRYVRTPKFEAQEDGRGGRVRGIFTQARGLGRNAGRPPADPANTHAVVHADRLLALSDAGRPWEIDPDDLRTLGSCTFDGRLPRLSRFSPHPKIDPVAGELFNFGLDLSPRLGPHIPAGLRCYRVDPAGRLHTEAVVPLDDAIIQHDFAITEHYLVFALAPIAADPIQAAMAMLGITDLGAAAAYRPQLGMKIVLVPRGRGKQRVSECDPLLYVHVNNAYEDGGDVVLDLVEHPNLDFLTDGLKDFRERYDPEFGWPTRLRITRTGRVLKEPHELTSVELPTHDERRTGRDYRFGYFAQVRMSGSSAVVKVDHLGGGHRAHTFDDGEFPGEPVFVPRSAKAAEDDGWLLVVTYLAAEHRTSLVILDAKEIERKPVAVARLDGHFMPGFHGSFTDRVARPS